MLCKHTKINLWLITQINTTLLLRAFFTQLKKLLIGALSTDFKTLVHYVWNLKTITSTKNCCEIIFFSKNTTSVCERKYSWFQVNEHFFFPKLSSIYLLNTASLNRKQNVSIRDRMSNLWDILRKYKYSHTDHKAGTIILNTEKNYVKQEAVDNTVESKEVIKSEKEKNTNVYHKTARNPDQLLSSNFMWRKPFSCYLSKVYQTQMQYEKMFQCSRMRGCSWRWNMRVQSQLQT